MRSRIIKNALFFWTAVILLTEFILGQAAPHEPQYLEGMWALIITFLDTTCFVLLVASAGIFLIWFINRKDHPISILAFVLGGTLYLCHFVSFEKLSFIGYFLPDPDMVINSAFYLFQVWLALRLLLGRQLPGEYRWMGIFPGLLIAAGWTRVIAWWYLGFTSLFYFLMVCVAPAVILAVILTIVGLKSRQKTEPSADMKIAQTIGVAPAASAAEVEPMPVTPVPPGETATAEPIPATPAPPIKTIARCQNVALAVSASDTHVLKQKSDIFSASLVDQIVGLQDRVVFQNIVLAVVELAPDGPAVIKADTRVAIRVSDEPVRIQCPKCSRLQSTAGQTCETCRSPLPVIFIEG